MHEASSARRHLAHEFKFTLTLVTSDMWHMTQCSLWTQHDFSNVFAKKRLGPPSSDLWHVTYDTVGPATTESFFLIYISKKQVRPAFKWLMPCDIWLCVAAANKSFFQQFCWATAIMTIRPPLMWLIYLACMIRCIACPAFACIGAPFTWWSHCLSLVAPLASTAGKSSHLNDIFWMSMICATFLLRMGMARSHSPHCRVVMCSAQWQALAQVFGKIDVEGARYSVMKTISKGIVVRRYAPCVAVDMPCARMDGRDGAFGRLDSYIEQSFHHCCRTKCRSHAHCTFHSTAILYSSPHCTTSRV